ncbi:MAG: SDR family oxidoreductase [Halioglobus sp.]|nr:SDR family oxidoreductase [Halioglobus sp.]
MDRFSGKVALVTGASSGLGAAVATRLAAEGAQVFGIARNRDALVAIQQQVRSDGGDMAIAVTDVGAYEQCIAAVAKCVEQYGQLDCLVNVAGSHRFHHTPEITPQEWRQELDINLNGPFFLCQAALPHLLASKGNIVNVASIAGLEGQPYSASYCAAKHGLIGFSKSLALEYTKHDLRVNVVCPGGMATPQIDNIQIPEDADFDLLMRSAALRGMMDAKEVASVIAFLASADASAVHGAVYTVDRGKTCG